MNNVNKAELNELIAQATVKVEALITQAYIEGFDRGVKAEKAVFRRPKPKYLEQAVKEASANIAESIRAKLTPLTAQDIRDSIVEQAKRDVTELGRERTYTTKRCYTVITKRDGAKGCFAEFIVNAEKRTVVVLMRGFATKKIFAKGIARCAPSDCFNAHIGRAIALRRALGLEVPSEYLTAPQPTELRVGDAVGYPFDPNDNERFTVEQIAKGRAYFKGGLTESTHEILRVDEEENSIFDVRIIDDTRGESE